MVESRRASIARPIRILNLSERQAQSLATTLPSPEAGKRLDWWTKTYFYGDKSRLAKWIRLSHGMTADQARGLIELDQDFRIDGQSPKWLARLDDVFSDDNWSRVEREVERRVRLAQPLEPDIVVLPFVAWTLPFYREILDSFHVAGLAFDPRCLQPAGDYLAGRLGRMAERSIVVAMNVARLAGLLAGDNPQQRAKNFSQQLLKRDSRALHLAPVPVVDRRLAHFTFGSTEALRELGGRLTLDWGQISETFGLAGRLMAVAPGLGDPHKNGRTVASLTFEDGKIIYKPRSMGVDVAFGGLIGWLNERSDLCLANPTVVDCGTHGWTEFIRDRECEDEDGVRRGHRRMGALLALMHVCGGNDAHYENIIFDGDYPHVIDLETVMSPFPRSFGDTDTGRSFGMARHRSILRVGYLPMRALLNDVVVDLSGVGLHEDQDSPLQVPTINDARRDDASVVLKRNKMIPGQNHPRLYGKNRPGHLYAREIQDGFSTAYRVLLQNRAELVAPDGPLAPFAQAEIRWVPRATLEYAKTQFNTCHPYALRDGVEHDMVIARTLEPAGGQRYLHKIISSEVADIWHGDVPYFSAIGASRNLRTSSKVAVKNFFEETAFDAMMRNVASLSQDDLEAQLQIIHMALATSRMSGGPEQPADPFDRAVGTDTSAGRIEAKCVEIGDRLLRSAHVADGCAYWVTLRAIDEASYGADLARADLYGGSGGIGLYLAELYRTTGLDRFRHGAAQCLNTVRALGPGNPGAVGGFEGYGGLLYAELRIGHLIGDESGGLVRSRLKTIRELAPEDQLLDVIAGSAGGALSALTATTRSEFADEAIETARVCAQRLCDTVRRSVDGACWKIASFDVPLTGLSHGAGGMAYALGAVAKVTSDRNFSQLAWEALRFEDASYDPAARGWRDLRGGNVFPAAWCHGSAGMTLARQKLADLALADGPDLKDAISRGLDAVVYRGKGGSHCLCHGAMGNLEPLLRAGGGYAQIARSAVTAVLGEIADEGRARCGVANFEETPDLMTGIAGVGLGLLRANAPNIPSVLLLEGDGEIGGRVH